MPFGVGNYQTFRSPQPRPTTQMRPDNRPGPYGAAPAFPSLASGPQRATPPPIQTPTPGQRAPAAPQPQGQPQAPPMQPSPINPQPTATPVAPTVSYDYNTDPILQQIKGLSTQSRSNAQSQALAAKKQLAIDYGDTALGTQFDANTVAAAQQNPFSVAQQLTRGYQQGAHNLDEQLNNQNLFYSGYRTQQQGDLSHDYQGQQASAAGQEQGLLGGIDQNLAAALYAADQQDIQAQQAAAAAAIQQALASGTGGSTPADLTAATGADPIQQALADTQQPAPPDQPPPPDQPATYGGYDIGQYNAGALANVAPADIASLLYPTASPAPAQQQQFDPLGYALSQQNAKKLLNLAV